MAEQAACGAVVGVTDEGYPIVTEDYGCAHWVGAAGGRTALRECWYCKYADFRKSTQLHLSCSICRCMENRVDTRLGFVKNEH